MIDRYPVFDQIAYLHVNLLAAFLINYSRLYVLGRAALDLGQIRIVLPHLFQLFYLSFGFYNLLFKFTVLLLQRIHLLNIVGTPTVLQSSLEDLETEFDLFGHRLNHVLNVGLKGLKAQKHVLNHFNSISRLNFDARFQGIFLLSVQFFNLLHFKRQILLFIN